MDHNNYKEKYELLKEKGKGSYGTVFKAKVKGKDEYRAIKILNKEDIKKELRNKHHKQDVEQEFIPYIKDFENNKKFMNICQKNNINSVRFYEDYDTDDEYVIP